MGLVQLELGHNSKEEMNVETALQAFDEKTKIAFELMENKNHDYG